MSPNDKCHVFDCYNIPLFPPIQNVCNIWTDEIAVHQLLPVTIKKYPLISISPSCPARNTNGSAVHVVKMFKSPVHWHM